MKTLIQIRLEIAEKINKSLASKGYNTAEPIDLNPDDVFNLQVSGHFEEINADYHFQIEVFNIKSSKHDIRITGTYDVNTEVSTEVSRRMTELSIEQLRELYKSVKKLPNCDVED